MGKSCSIHRSPKGALALTQLYSIYILLFLVIVFPNVFREIKAVALFLIIALSPFSITPISKMDLLGLGLMGISWIGSIFLIIFGSMQAIPGSEIYVLGSYVLAPAVWWFVLSRLLKLAELDRVIHFILMCGVIAAIQITLFFVFFDYLAPAIKNLLIEDPNVSLSSSGTPAVRLHSISSLLFIVPAFFSLLIDRKTYLIPKFSWVIASIFLIASIISGRSALIVAVLASLAIFGVVGGMRRIGLIVSVGLCVMAALYFVDVNLASALSNVIDKVSSFGGEERLSQRDALVYGFATAPLVGQGHGVSASVIRSGNNPWRYELFYHALLFHGGLFGFFTYMAPILVALASLLIGTARKNPIKRFALFGLSSFLVATYTNPYIEGLESQWMWILPLLIGLRSSYRSPQQPSNSMQHKPSGI